MLERTLVFVDTSYLLASFYNSWDSGARGQLEIDLPEVVSVLDRMITQQLGQPIHRQLWFDGIPETGPHRYQRALRNINGVQLRAGQLIEWGDRRTQKGVDTRLVVDMVLAAVGRQVSDMVLVSGDADMLPGVQEVTQMGVRVHLYGFGWDSMASVLRHACDSTTILDPREDFEAAMQLQPLEGPLPPVIRPADDNAETADSNDAAEQDEEAPATPTTRPADDTAAEAAAELAADVEAEVDLAERETVQAEIRTETVRPSDLTRPMNTSRWAQHGPIGGQPPAVDGSEAEPSTEAVEAATAAQVEAATEAAEEAATPQTATTSTDPAPTPVPKPGPSAGRPNPSMMAPRRKLRSRYVPLPNEVWSSAGFQTPYDVGQQYATWWYEQAATEDQRDKAHLLSGGGLPPDIDRPLLQFACETLHEYTLTESQRVNLRDGFHSGIRAVLMNLRNG
ncbi:NYN domain-containing protein [Corynebacterium ulceribovis]|uniref:NYN domain-containing protein n=1 Tax=Corynebacterium ulceribovis TaxID=487732 RepID=UPI000370C400|nr:NYN domain-containing protein [Corynebacterium ulceribovis]